MYHKGNIFSDYNLWWEDHEEKYSDFNIEKQDFESFKFKNGFNKGDILFIIGARPEKLKLGDVVIFNGGARNPIIHRVIKIEHENEGYVFSTIGDNNDAQILFEKNIDEGQLMGRAAFKIAPYLGWGKLIFFEPSKPESERGFCEEN